MRYGVWGMGYGDGLWNTRHVIWNMQCVVYCHLGKRSVMGWGLCGIHRVFWTNWGIRSFLYGEWGCGMAGVRDKMGQGMRWIGKWDLILVAHPFVWGILCPRCGVRFWGEGYGDIVACSIVYRILHPILHLPDKPHTSLPLLSTYLVSPYHSHRYIPHVS